MAHIERPCFFDRGIIDTLGYARLIGIPISDRMNEAANTYRYNSKVFLFPFWEEIYVNDAERKQNQEEARETCRVLKDVYENFGYEIVNVPFLSPEERGEWILQNI